MKINDSVITRHGAGIIKKIEEYKDFKRYGVLHDVDPYDDMKLFDDKIMYYFKKRSKIF